MMGVDLSGIIQEKKWKPAVVRWMTLFILKRNQDLIRVSAHEGSNFWIFAS